MALPKDALIKVVVVDDSQEFLEVVCQWILEQPRLQLVGTARNGMECIEVLQKVKADLVLMDAVMPVMNGFAATAHVKAKPAAPKIVILSMYDIEMSSLAIGADGFASKSDFIARIPRIVQSLFHDPVNPEPGAGTLIETQMLEGER